jgi:hypothetical protein
MNHEHRDQHVAIVELCPQKSRDERRRENYQTAHRRRALFLLMAVGCSLSDDLVQTHAPESADDRRADNERNEQRSDCRACGPERDVIEDSKKSEVPHERNEQIIEH